MKKIATLFVFVLLFCGNVYGANKYINMTLTYDFQNHKYCAEEVFVEVDGKRLTNLSMPPIIFDNYTLVPAREVFEAMGAKVEWKKEIEQVYITYNENVIVIPINSEKAYVNGKSESINPKAKIINNKTMIPLRFVSDNLKFETQWDSKTRVANIVTKNNDNTEITTKAVTVPAAQTTVQTTTEAVTEPVTLDLENIKYNNDTLYIKKQGFDKKDITEFDNYFQKNYTVEINSDLSNIIENCSVSPNSKLINNCTVKAEKNKTVITFNENNVIALDISESNGFMVFKAVSPKEKYDKIVVIDPGHGGDKPGAMHNNLTEKDLTLKMALSAKEKLDADGSIKCYITRFDDTNPSFDDRVWLGNSVGDIFVSIHINSAESSEPNGTETYCQYANDPGNGLTSYMVADEMLQRLLENLGTKNREVKAGDLKVLRDSKIPATLLEIGFISNPQEAEMMNNSTDKVGQAVYDGLVNLFEKYPSVR